MCDSYVCAGYIYVLYLEALTSSKNKLDPANYKLLTVSSYYVDMLLFLVFRAWLIASIATNSYSIQHLAI